MGAAVGAAAAAVGEAAEEEATAAVGEEVEEATAEVEEAMAEVEAEGAAAEVVMVAEVVMAAVGVVVVAAAEAAVAEEGVEEVVEEVVEAGEAAEEAEVEVDVGGMTVNNTDIDFSPITTASDVQKRDAATPAAVAAITSTFVETTYTVTSTSTILAKQETDTETVWHDVTRTYTRPAQTVCDKNSGGTLTVMSLLPDSTEVQVDYVTYTVENTIYVEQTETDTWSDYYAATACWGGGGWYGV
ncbi:hypothetical protein GQ53DRAFT_831589 [Thozetella sp. PMI_491]|nr:hypothetical protein GQ53DRAFT_831589 [Thozetella sp. PMI_491]